ncbi:MAG: protoporphyrinogen oxidase [Chlamydiales bacterium]
MKIGVLGAGIAGLSLAYYLRKKWPDCEITLVDKAERAGGVLSSVEEGDFFFSQGPSIFYTKRSFPLIQLIKDLGLESEVISYAPANFKRYFWLDERLQTFTYNPIALFYSSLSRAIYGGLMREWSQPKNEDDESVYSFASRRFGRGPMEKILEPMMLSAHAGDIRNLSAWVTLRRFKELEKDYGSITRGMRLRREDQGYCPIDAIEQSDLFSLRGGMSALIEPLLKLAQVQFKGGTSVEAISPDGSVMTNQGKWEFDRVFSTLPLPALASAIDHPEVASFSSASRMTGIITVNLGYAGSVLKKKGIGYFVPTLERDDCLNAIFDSHIFPQQNKQEGQTRLTYTLGGSLHPEFFELSDEEILMRIYGCTHRHLDIGVKPDVAIIERYPDSLIEYCVGYNEKLQQLQIALKEQYPQLTLAGTVLGQFTVNDLIEKSAKITEHA